jgi:hypothetical protein
MTATEKPACSAQLLTDGWECQACGLAWDDGDAQPSCNPMTFARMLAATLEEAEELEQSQRALTEKDGLHPPFRKYRYQPKLQRAMELRACARLIEKVTGDREILDRLKAGAKKAGI